MRGSVITAFISITVGYFVFCQWMSTVSGTALIRVKRQNRQRSGKREEGAVNFETIDESLYGWIPRISRSCPPRDYVCRDRSYCFPEKNLCNDIVSCDDQSDEINALCGYTTTEIMATTIFNTDTAHSTRAPGDNSTRNRFNDPLVIAFLVFVASMLIYVVGTTIYCIKNRLKNTVRPGDMRAVQQSKNHNSLDKMRSQQNVNEHEGKGKYKTEPTADMNAVAIGDVN